MSWEVDGIQREVQQIKNQQYRFVDREELQRAKRDIEASLMRKADSYEVEELRDIIRGLQRNVELLLDNVK